MKKDPENEIKTSEKNEDLESRTLPDIPEGKGAEENGSDIDSDESESKGNVSVKSNKTLDLIAKIGCVIIAFLIWFYVMASDSPTSEKTFQFVPVKLVNDSGMSVLSWSATVVDVTVKGKRSALNKITEEDIEAYIDVSDVTKAGRYKRSVEVNLPAGVSLAEVSPGNLTLEMDATTTMLIPVSLRVSDYMLEDGYELGENDAVLSVTEITVSGPENVLERIDSAQLTVQPGYITRSITYTGELVPVDADGNEITSNYLKMQTTEATVVIPVYKYATIPLEVSCKYGYFNESNSIITVSPSHITVKGEEDIVDSASWSYELDEKKITSDVTYTVDITLPHGLVNVDGTDTASISINHVNTSTKQLTVTDITVINPKELVYELSESNVVITVRGPSNLVSYITAASVHAQIDLSAQKNVSGYALIPITFNFDSIYDGSVYEIGSYSMSVRIT